MKTFQFIFFACIILHINNEASGQWSANGNNIYNTNSGNVGIGTNTPSTLLHVGKNMTEPNIMVQNQGGSGGATFTMKDDASGANWKFKATLTGGFKIRDHANGLDVIVIEPGSFANAIYIKSLDNIGIGTANPNNSAMLELNSASKGFLIPRMTISQIEVITNPADGLQVYCTTDGKLYIFVAQANEWKELSYASGVIEPPFTCGMNLTINHIQGEVAPVNKTTTYGTVTNIPGEPTKCWITSNLGSDHQATSVDDATESSAGWYWQFNRQQGYKHDGVARTPNISWITEISENSDWISANDPCALLLENGWRVPTFTEWNNIFITGNWVNWWGPWYSDIKMHAAGYINAYDDEAIFHRGIDAGYWSINQSNNTSGGNLYFNAADCDNGIGPKANGLSVRCIK